MPRGKASDSSIRRILGRIRIDEVSNLTLELARIRSPRGFEAEVGDFIHQWMLKNGIESHKQRVSEGRNNVIGILKGTEGHPSLIFNSHMDTGFGLPEDYWILGDEKRVFREETEKGDYLVGMSVINDKGPMAAFLVAAKAIKKSGIKLRGDVILTCVVGEIGQAPVDEFVGERYEGKGFGSRYLVSHGVTADYAIVAEGTNFAVARGEAGDVWFKISIFGKGGVYTPFIERPFTFKDNPNAIFKAAPVIQALEAWARRYENEHRLEFVDGVIVPKVNIGAIRGGLPVRPTQTPGICSLYVDVRLTPADDVEKVKGEVERVVSSCNVDFSVETYLYRKGHIAKNADRLVEGVRKAQKRVLGEYLKKCPAPFISMWRDLNVFNEAGIPSITYGPRSYTYQDLAGDSAPSIKKADLRKAAQIYALTALEICGPARA
jgi:acetylornithine deacetylase/succinyl-diaminopimelate desuccinylase-like protein